MPDGISFEEALKPKEPQGISFEDALKPAQKPTAKDDLPWDVPMTGAQMRAAQEQTRKGEEAIARLPFPLRIAARGGQQMLGERPPPTPKEALEEAALGAPLGLRTPRLFGIARTAAEAAPRVEPTMPGGGQQPPAPPEPQGGLTLEEALAPPAPAEPPARPTVELGGMQVGEAGPRPASVPQVRPSDPGQPRGLAEAGITPTPEPATGTETIAVPQADGTVAQVQVQTGPSAPAARPPVEGGIPETVSQQPWSGPRTPEPGPSLQDAGITPTPEPADPWAPVAEAPEGQPEAETPVGPPAGQQPAPPPEQVPASALKPGDKVIVGDQTHEVEAVRPWTGDQVGVKLKGDPKLHTGPSDAPVQKVPEPAPEPTAEEKAKAPVEGYGGPWMPVLKDDGSQAKNSHGDALFQNANGVRAHMEGNVPFTEMTRETEKGLEPRDIANRKPLFMTEDETAPAKSKPKPKAEPKQEPKPEGEGTTEVETSTAEPRPASPRLAVPNLAVPSRGTPRLASGETNISQNKTESQPKPANDWVEAGKNADGQTVFANPSGVHSTLDGGVRTVEKVRLRPTKGGMEMSVPPNDQKDPEFQVVTPAPKAEAESQGETGGKAGETAPKPAAKPKVESQPEPAPPKSTPEPSIEEAKPEVPKPTEHPGLKIKSLETGKETVIQPIGTVPPALKPVPTPQQAFRSAIEASGNRAVKDGSWSIIPKGRYFAVKHLPPGPYAVPSIYEPTRGQPGWSLERAQNEAVERAFAPKAEEPTAKPTPEEAFAAADAAWRAYQPTYEKALADYRAQKIGDDEYLKVRAEHERLRDAVDAAEEALPDAEELEKQRRLDAGIEEFALDQAYAQADDPALEAQMDDIRDMFKNGWLPGDIAAQPTIDRTPAEIRALHHVWREQEKLPWEPRDIGQSELPLTQKEHYDALFPADTPAATGEPEPPPEPVEPLPTTSWAAEVKVDGKWSRNATRFATKEEAEAAAADIHSRWMMSEGSRATEAAEPPNYKWEPGTGPVPIRSPKPSLNAPSQEPTSEQDGTEPAGSGSDSLGQPGGGKVRAPRSGSRSGGRGGRGKGLAPQPAPDVPAPESTGDPGEDGVRPEPEVPGGDEPLPDVGDAADGLPGASGEGVDAPGPGGSTGNVVPELDLDDPTDIKPPSVFAPVVDLPAARPNFHISDPEAMVGGAAKKRFNRNRRAIEAFRSIFDEGRHPTDEELETMAGFTGWGSFGQDLFQGTFERPIPREGWDTEGQWLRQHLGPEAWRGAQASIRNAHYTDPPTVQAMWDMVRHMGFDGGRVLEPSMGVGNFFGLMPRDLMARSTLTGIELEPTTGGMAQLLYPQAGVFIKGFQESQTPDNFYDLVIGNWPFDATPPADRRYNRLKPTLHDYFYLKALDQTRPGGLVVGITSAGTMDKMDRLARMEMAKKGELIASFRLPSGAFEQYAGTKVITDIVILRKREEPLTDAAAEEWINTREMQTPEGSIRVNQYYHDHPENVLGTFGYGSGTTTYRPGMLVHRPDDLMDRLKALPEKLPTDAYQPKTRGNEPRFVTNNTADRLNSVVVGEDGKLYQVAGERLLLLGDVHKNLKAGSAKVQKQRIDQIKDLVAMRKAYGALIDGERDGVPEVEVLRKTLNDLYQAYNKANKGKLTDTDGMKVLDKVKDPNWPILASLQRPDGTPAQILTQATTRQKRTVGNPSVADAYVMARNESLNLNMERIAEIAGRPVEEVEKNLLDSGAVALTPGGGYEPSDGYLSGNVRMKLREAEDAVARGEPMEASVEALKKVIPPNTPYYQIEAKFGAPWVDNSDYQQFIAQHLLDLPESRWPEVHVGLIGGRWHVQLDGNLNYSIEATQTHGHSRYRFDRLLDAALGNVTPRIMDPKDDDGGPYYNEKASEEVATRIQEVREKFQDWAWADAERTVRLENAFNESMNAIAKPHFDGSFLDMSGMALRRGDDPFDMRRHQANAIWRGISLGRGAFFHEVGTGKTYTIGGIAIEGRRFGKWNKPMVIAHNANSKSVAADIQQMYPGAKILSLDSDDLTPKTLKQSMYSIRNEDWDLVVVQHSHLDRFALKRETLMGLAREQITAMEDEMYAAADEDGENLDNVNLDDPDDVDKKIRSITAKELAKQRLKILATIEAQAQRASREDAVPFEDLGVDAIFVDEAHEFKKPPLATRMRLKGLNTKASTRSIALDFLTKYIKTNNNGNGVFLFTGTPVTNSLNEIFNMARYFMDDVMKRDGINDWDTWFNTFADALNDVELVTTGDYESIRRLSSFVNVDELVRVMSQFTDVVQASDMPEFVDRATPASGNSPGKTLSSPDLTPDERDFLENGRTENPAGRPYKRIINDVGEILPEQAVIQAELREIIRDFKAAPPRWRKENKHIPLVVEGDMNRTSLDARTYDPSLGENPNNKINRVSKNVLEIYQTPKAAQMIFVDQGYNPSKKSPNFSVVPDLIAKLVAGGIPRNEIAVIAGDVKPDQKKAIADKMNSGEIRVAIGQSGTMGVGVNAQVNLRAMHHMDAPWMPGELEQRDGRGHRQGNSWNTVLEYRYITEGLDGKRWQVLTIKDRFIKQFIGAFNDTSGKRIGVIEGDAADISEKEDIVGTLSAAAGDPRLLQKEKLKADVNRLERRERVHRLGVADAAERARRLTANVEPAKKSRAKKEGWIQTWLTAQERMEEAAKEAGSKLRWYDATIDGQPMNTAADIQDALDKRVLELAQNEGKVKIGTINGLGIVAEWPKGWAEPQYDLTDDAGDTVSGVSALTVNRIVGRIQALKNDLDGSTGWLGQMQEDIAKLQKAADQQFTQGPTLMKKRQQLAQIEDDMQENPIPPPAWLRHGAPIDTPIWVDGKERMVRGHRMTDDYYIATDEGQVPYMQVTDKNGFSVYTQRPRPPAPPPKDLPTWAPPLIARVEGAEVIWHKGGLVLVKAKEYGEDVYLGFKQGLTEDQQAWNVYGMRGAFDIKDIERLRKEAENYRDREQNRQALEKAQEPKPAATPPGPLLLTHDPATPWIKGADPAARDVVAERDAETKRLRRAADLRAWNWIKGKPN